MKRRAAFTLIEVLAVVLLTGIVMGIALNFYLDLSRASNRAAEQTRGTRRAAALLDRIARDFAGVVFLHKPDALDPLAHPWIFLADSGGEFGAERVKFMTRNHDPHRTAVPESDLAVVSYVLRRGEEGGLELWRSESSQLPESLDREFPAAGSDGEALLADGIAGFGLTFLPSFDAGAQPKASWDSSSLVDAGELPAGVLIQLAMADPAGERPLEELTIHRRRVLFIVRPLDLAALLGEGDAGGNDDEDKGDLSKKKVCDCVDCAALSTNPSAAKLIQEIGGQPAQVWLPRLPANFRELVKPECL
jgi:prepilin-type N-terminal cleavage/methylation domain-containing protein